MTERRDNGPRLRDVPMALLVITQIAISELARNAKDAFFPSKPSVLSHDHRDCLDRSSRLFRGKG